MKMIIRNVHMLNYVFRDMESIYCGLRRAVESRTLRATRRRGGAGGGLWSRLDLEGFGPGTGKS